MRERDPFKSSLRFAAHLARLGPGPHICLFCGTNDPEGRLIPKSLSWIQARVSRSVLEEHHVFCENHDPNFTVLFCILCHFKVSQGYFEAGIEMRPEPDRVLRAAYMLQARAVFGEHLAAADKRLQALLVEAVNLEVMQPKPNHTRVIILAVVAMLFAVDVEFRAARNDAENQWKLSELLMQISGGEQS
jgi:hypothetical protein